MESLHVSLVGNLKCEGENELEQKEFCHYTRHSSCGPPAKLILEGLNISASPGSGIGKDGLCTCKFRGGLRVCDDSKYSIVLMYILLMCFNLITEDENVGINPGLILHVISLLILSVFFIEVSDSCSLSFCDTGIHCSDCFEVDCLSSEVLHAQV